MPNRLSKEKSPYLLQHADNPLLRLHRLTGEDAYADRADKLARACSPLLTAAPSAHTIFMLALTEHTSVNK